MLTASQCEIVAFVSNGGIICRDCATRQYGEMGVAAIEEGIAEFVPSDVSPLIRYELDEYQGNDLWEQAEEIVRNGEDEGFFDDDEYYELSEEDRVQRVFDARSDIGYPCDNCGEEIS